MKHHIIPFFLSNRGCRSRCIFCSRLVTTGSSPRDITRDYFRTTVENHLHTGRRSAGIRQIAFYGGNFTGMSADDQNTLLEYAREFIDKGSVDSVRISTRPDFINRENLLFLKAHSVRTVEIGAQSMADGVLQRAQRGHTADDTRRACTLLNEMGFEIAIHLMIGLPGDNDEGFFRSVDDIICLRPHAVRLHPVLVFRDTPLAQLSAKGRYHPLSLDHAVSLASRAYTRFREVNIAVIRMGLFTSADTLHEKHLLAGPYHPSFGALVKCSHFLTMALSLIASIAPPRSEISLCVAPRDISNLRGLNNANMQVLREKAFGHPLEICVDTGQPEGGLSLLYEGRRYSTAPSYHGRYCVEHNDPHRIIPHHAGREF